MLVNQVLKGLLGLGIELWVLKKKDILSWELPAPIPWGKAGHRDRLFALCLLK